MCLVAFTCICKKSESNAKTTQATGVPRSLELGHHQPPMTLRLPPNPHQSLSVGVGMGQVQQSFHVPPQQAIARGPIRGPVPVRQPPQGYMRPTHLTAFRQAFSRESAHTPVAKPLSLPPAFRANVRRLSSTSSLSPWFVRKGQLLFKGAVHYDGTGRRVALRGQLSSLVEDSTQNAPAVRPVDIAK